MSNNYIDCPICSKQFSNNEITKHVDKCLFLNDTKTNKPILKEPSCSNSPEFEIIEKSKKRKTEASFVIEDNKKSTNNLNIPLAEKIRPEVLKDFIGQEKIIGTETLLYKLIEKNEITSMILWGPPGCGKTTLATIISKQLKNNNYRFCKLSAAMAGVNDVKTIITTAQNELNLTKRRTILFMDEIHRFNKLQQDIFLAHVENGTIVLIGATTENPSFSLNSALLSRCRVIVLDKLTTNNLVKILARAVVKVYNSRVADTIDGNNDKSCIENKALDWLANMCDGDARIALNTLQLAFESSTNNLVTFDSIVENLKKSHFLFDKKGDEHYNIISAVHKSIRASDPNAALYWVTRMVLGGEDPMYIARRLVRAASEDIGLADPFALTLAVSTMQGCQMIGSPECDVLLAQCAIYLAKAPKSREMDDVINACKNYIKNFQGAQPSVPLHLRNAPTKLMRDLNYGKGYNMNHKDESNLNYMPEGLEDVKFIE